MQYSILRDLWPARKALASVNEKDAEQEEEEEEEDEEDVKADWGDGQCRSRQKINKEEKNEEMEKKG